MGTAWVCALQVARAEEFLKRRIPVGSTFKTSRVQEEATGQVCTHSAVDL
jgi:hypothetical protein